MPTKTIVEDYVWAAIARAGHAWGENGTLVMTVPEFPGLVACGADIPSVVHELYRQLEDLVSLSDQRRFALPVLRTQEGEINLNTSEAHALIKYHERQDTRAGEAGEVFIGGPEEMETFLDCLSKGS